ncbi:alpha/beta fold hydrolase [Pararobbsia silviterrae]|uniref:Alpha/beta hydrolase n=1 Tax=Pararobbsia silviterrae TaxID=1792498 RepID=A0A494X7G5_9BURK|nr:alpha/beta hydrolase [Pararobbsia silviterrae]RKP46647.1 alpha/beta hydrolase [Pararobbsia silviterrae]
MHASTSEYVQTRGPRIHVRRWGRPDAPKLFMLHGWMDVAASFQFIADELADDWQILAPDARGFGLSDWPVHQAGGGNYWFPDYLVDLEALLDHYAPGESVNLVGHSMGANIVCLYAGVRPERVRRVVDLEGFGLRQSAPGRAAVRYAQWLDDIKTPPSLRDYADLDAVAARLTKTNPRLRPDRAAFLAAHWSRPTAEGRRELLADPAHKLRGPMPYLVDEVMSIWAKVAAPVLHVEALDSPTLTSIRGDTPLDAFRERFSAFPDWREAIIEHAGHMLHHDQPEQVATLIRDFCA